MERPRSNHRSAPSASSHLPVKQSRVSPRLAASLGPCSTLGGSSNTCQMQFLGRCIAIVEVKQIADSSANIENFCAFKIEAPHVKQGRNHWASGIRKFSNSVSHSRGGKILSVRRGGTRPRLPANYRTLADTRDSRLEKARRPANSLTPGTRREPPGSFSAKNRSRAVVLIWPCRRRRRNEGIKIST
jgi:hypothetical protein